MILFLTSVFLALFISAVCSLFEACLLSLTPSQVADITEKKPRRGQIWQRFKEDIQRPIAVILIVNTAAHTIGATVAGSEFEKVFIEGFGYGKNSILVFSLVFTFLMLAFTEIIPKTVGVVRNRQLAPAMAFPLAALVKIFHPVLVVFDWAGGLFGGKSEEEKPKATLEEISALAGLARLSNLISVQEERIIKEASQLSDTPVREVMIPIDQVTFLSSSQTLMDAVLKAHMDPHTRFPVCGGDDHNDILGYANFKEMIYHMRFNPKDPSLNGIIRPVHFTSPNASSADLLRTFVEEHVHMAIVSEGNRSVGLVTLEDIVEELVGEIEDEFDRVPSRCHELSGGTWMVGGGFSTTELASRLNATVPDAKGNVSTWLIDKAGRLPKVNEVFVIGGLRFVVCRLRRGKVFELAVRREGETRPTGMFPPPEEGIEGNDAE